MNRLDFRETGSALTDLGSGPAVVLLHGYPFDRSMWREQIEFLTAYGYRVVAPDLLGVGQWPDSHRAGFGVPPKGGPPNPASVPPNEAGPIITTMADMARDVAALIDELKIDQAVICGLSMGGYVALEFVHLFPSRVSALVLAGTRAPADNEQEKQARVQQVEQMLGKGMNGIAEASLPKLLAPRTLAEKPEVADRVGEMILRANPEGAASAQRGIAERRDYSNDLPGIKVPALIIVGRQDPIRPVADAEFMQRGLSDSRLVIIEDAAHMTNMEKPEVFNRALLNFIETCTNTAGASPPS